VARHSVTDAKSSSSLIFWQLHILHVPTVVIVHIIAPSTSAINESFISQQRRAQDHALHGCCLVISVKQVAKYLITMVDGSHKNVIFHNVLTMFIYVMVTCHIKTFFVLTLLSM